MEDKYSSESIKIAKLQGAADFNAWRRLIKAYLRKEDIGLLGLQENPKEETEAARTEWQKAQVVAKSNIILHLGPQPQIRSRAILDDDNRTAYELWTFLQNTYTATNEQAIQNLVHQLDNLLYKDGQDWDEHLSSFMTILGQLAAYNQELNEKEKTSKLIRSLPTSFAPIAMVATLLESFDKVESAVRAEVDRRKNPNNPQGSASHKKLNSTPQAYFSSNNNGQYQGNTQRKHSKGVHKKGKCRYCNKPGHYIKDCRIRKADEAEEDNQDQNFTKEMEEIQGINTEMEWEIDTKDIKVKE